MKLSYFSPADYANAIRNMIAQGQLEAALIDICLRAEAIKNDPMTFSRIMGSPTFDKLCAELGEALRLTRQPAESRRQDSSPARAIYICTETLRSGGHTRVVADLIRAAPEFAHHVILTNLWERPTLHTKEFESLGAEVSILPKASMFDKLGMLIDHLNSYAGARVFLLNHHQDGVAVAAVGASRQQQRYFIHHCDYLFCLGVFLPDVTHVDLHSMGFRDCRNNQKIDHNVYWPITCEDDARFKSDGFLGAGQLVTCCCGDEHKFTGRYPIDYIDTIAEMLRVTGGKHIHIGALQQPLKQRLYAKLTTVGVAAEKFVHFPHVPNLRLALLDLGVDAYITSFPIGGGRAVVEAMSAGIPVVGHLHHHNNTLGGTDMLPEAAPCWSSPTELLAILQSLDANALRTLSTASRERYEVYHHPRLLSQGLHGEVLPLPPQRIADAEALQVFLFEKFFLTAPAAQPAVSFSSSWRLGNSAMPT